MRHSVSHEVLAIGQIQQEVDTFLDRRLKGFEEFFDVLYKETVLTTVHLVEALDCKEQQTSPPQSLRVSVRQRSHASAPTAPEGETGEGDGCVRYREKWKGEERVSIEGGCISDGRVTMHEVPLELQSIATPIPEFDFGEMTQTPPSQSLRMSFVGGGVEWGDRFRSMTSLDVPGFRPMPFDDGDPSRIVFENIMRKDPEDQAAAPQPDPETPMEESTVTESPQTIQDPIPIPVKNTTEKEIPIQKNQEEAVEATAEKEMSAPARKVSMIPKPPAAPVSTIQKMKNLVTLVDRAPVDLMDIANKSDDSNDAAPLQEVEADGLDTEVTHPVEDTNGVRQQPDGEKGAKHGNITSNVRTFVGCIKSHEEHQIAAGNHKAEIPALKKAAAARELAIKREDERKKRKDQMAQWKQQQKKPALPVKLASKPDMPPPGTKRPTEVEPSPNKKQRLETAKRFKKNGHQAAQARRQMAQTTPVPNGIQEGTTGDPNQPQPSPQYNLTPAGLLQTDTRTKRKERRREKHIPSWAEDMALQNNAMRQRATNPTTIFPSVWSLPPRQVFGTPDSMVVRDAADRTYRYDNRAPSSVDWSDDEKAE